MPILPRNVNGGNEDNSNKAPRPIPAWEVVVVAESGAGTFNFHSNSNEQPLPSDIKEGQVGTSNSTPSGEKTGFQNMD